MKTKNLGSAMKRSLSFATMVIMALMAASTQAYAGPSARERADARIQSYRDNDKKHDNRHDNGHHYGHNRYEYRYASPPSYYMPRREVVYYPVYPGRRLIQYRPLPRPVAYYNLAPPPYGHYYSCDDRHVFLVRQNDNVIVQVLSLLIGGGY